MFVGDPHQLTFVAIRINQPLWRFGLINKPQPMSRKKPLDLQQLDPNWKLAEDHAKANKPGLYPKEARFDSILLCPCCLNLINKEPMRMCENSKQLSFLGVGFPLFYNLLQFCITSMIILILTEDLILIYLSIQQKCQDPSAGAHRVLVSEVTYKRCHPFIRIARLQPNVSQIDIITRILSFVAQLLLMIYFRDSQRKLAAYHEERTLRIKDYSLIFKNLPKMNGIQKCITDFLQTECSDCQPLIKDIMLIPHMEEYHEKEREKEMIVRKKKKILQDPDSPHFHDMVNQIDTTIDQINMEMTNICRRIDNMFQKDTLYAEKAIVIVNTVQQKIDILAKFKEMPKRNLQKYFSWMGDEVQIKQAPDPKEIIWENVNFPKNERWFKVLIGWILSGLVLGGITTVVYFLISAKGQMLDSELHNKNGYTRQQFRQAEAIVFITIISVQLFNKFIMKAILHKICDFEKPETTSQLEFSYAFKYTLGMFFTTAVMTLAVEALKFKNYAGEYGVVEEETIIFFFNAYFVNLLWIVHPQFLWRRLMRWLNKGKTNLTQKEANELMEEYPYDMGKRYAEILQTMWFTFLYSSLIPLGSCLSLTGFIIYYWVDKYNLLRRSTLSSTIQSKLPMNATKLMEFTIIFKPIGEIIFDRQLRGKVHPSSIIMVIVGFVYLILPWDRILIYFFDEKFNIEQRAYAETEHIFTDVYKTLDPIHRQLALDKFLTGRNMKNHTQKMMINQYDDRGLPGIDETSSEFMISLNTSRLHKAKVKDNDSSSSAAIFQN